MSRPAALFLTAMGLVTIALGALDYAATRRQSTRWKHKVVELVNDYRFGTADRPFEEELAEIEAESEKDEARSRLRTGAAGLLGLLMLVVGVTFLRGRSKSSTGPSRTGASARRDQE